MFLHLQQLWPTGACIVSLRGEHQLQSIRGEKQTGTTGRIDKWTASAPRKFYTGSLEGALRILVESDTVPLAVGRGWSTTAVLIV